VSTVHNPDNLDAATVGTGWRLCTVEEVERCLPDDAEVQQDSGNWTPSACIGEGGLAKLTYRTRTRLPADATPLAQIRRIYAAATPRQQAAVRRWGKKL
jgi:hypothetical protein